MPHTLLLADDSVTIQRVIELTFADEDVEVIAVSDGGQAIERLEAAPPDIVLADVAMPRVNGYQVAQYIRQTPRLAHIPVVLLTGAFEPVDRSRAAEAGCDDVLAKPFEPQMVIGRVKELLARPRSASAYPGFSGQTTVAQGFATGTPESALGGGTPGPEFMPGVQTGPLDELDEYFDRLDAAFASLSNEPLRLVKPSPPPPGAESADHIDFPAGLSDETFEPLQSSELKTSDMPPIAAGRVEAANLRATGAMDVELEEWLAHDAEAGSIDLPISPPAPPPQRDVVTHTTAATDATLPPMADAFAALLAAELNEPPPPPGPSWHPPGVMSPAVTDDLVDQVTRRVLERLADRVVRDSIVDIVSKVAERLVREEIDRIKSSIK
jgi:CheY-like chemotaxis protein